MDFFDIGLTLASVICAAGVFRHVVAWFNGPDVETGGRSSGSLPRRIVLSLRAVILDVLLLVRSARTGWLRWLAHCLVFFGFMGLLLFHALDGTVTARFFPAYEPTLDPWQLLRNLFGAMTLLGLVVMIWRRWTSPRVRATSRFQDWAAYLVIGGIIFSGFLLEASKIMSPAVFTRMTDEYFFAGESGEMTALKAYWAHEYGVVFPEKLPMDQATLELGRELDDSSCTDCHSNTASAFVSRALASVFGPVAPAMNISRADEVFWYVHLIFCFIGLAALPFGKFLHPLTTPIQLAVRRGRRDGAEESSNAIRGLGMDACTRCGECSVQCSVAPSFSVLGNADILPSEKLASLKRFWSDNSLSGEELARFAQGSRICTECLRCTDVCPAGINLQDLWLASKPQVSAASPDPDHIVRNLIVDEWTSIFGHGVPVPPISGLADNAESYWACVQCTTCTSVCPVVAVSEDPTRDLDLTPQQIMNLLRMGLKDQAMGARMIWSCTTCYKCQEHCPQNIRVADVLYELRNTVAARLDGNGERDGGAS